MPKTLAEMRQSPSVGLQERTYPMCLAQKLVAEVQELNEERNALLAKALVARGDEDKPTRPRRAGESLPPRLAEIENRLSELEDEMAEHTGKVHLRAEETGKWRRWAQDHPPREIDRTEQGDPIYHPVDVEIGYGFVNADDLFDRLGDFVTAWNDEAVDAETWSWIVSKAAGGDLNELCRQVVSMHEGAGAKAPHREGSRH